jgi:uncharacterized membrane protein
MFMAEPNVKEAKLQVKFEDIKFNEENKVKAILACIPIVGLILLFVEKDDQFVRYYGAQYTIVYVAAIVLYMAGVVLFFTLPFIGLLLAFLFWLVRLAFLVFIIMGMVKANNGEKFQIPMIHEYALKLMSSI